MEQYIILNQGHMDGPVENAGKKLHLIIILMITAEIIILYGEHLETIVLVVEMEEISIFLEVTHACV